MDQYTRLLVEWLMMAGTALPFGYVGCKLALLDRDRERDLQRQDARSHHPGNVSPTAGPR